jgi:hypothetical protein
MSLVGLASVLAIHGSKNSNLALVSNRYFSGYNLVLKRLSNTFKRKVYIRSPLLLYSLSLLLSLKLLI